MIVKFSQPGMVMPSQEVVREMMRNQEIEPTISNPKIHAETNKYPNCVQLQARGKGRSRRVLHFEHIRIWACQITQRDGSGMNQTTGGVMSTQLICHTKGSWILNKPIISSTMWSITYF